MVFLQGFFANNKLRNRFVVFLFVLSAAPVIVLGVMIFSFIDRSHRSDVALMAQQTLAQKEEEINAFLSDAASLLSLRVGFEARAEISKTDQEFLLSGFLQENSSIEEVAFINLQGQEVTKKTRSGLPPALESVSTSPYYLKALLGQATIGQILSGSQGTMFVVASPVKNRKNEIIQVLAAKVSTAPIAASVSRARLGQDGYLILLDQAGSVIAGGEQFGLAAGAKFAGNAQVRRLLRPGEVFDGSGGEDRYESDISNTKVVGAGKRLQGPNWILLVEWPVHDADAVLIEIQKQAVWTILVAILFILVAVPVFVNQLILPIRKLKQGAERVQQGDFEYNVDIQTKDELEELGGAFNNMTRGLKRLRELQNEFVYIASHELRIPLTAMRWSIEKLTEELPGALSDVAGKMMAKAREASEHLSQLVDEILLIAKTEAGRLEIQVAPCDLVETVERALSETQPLATERAIRVQYEKPASPLRVFAHEVRLQEVLLNLIGNALKYNHGKGGVRIWHEERGNKVVTHVQDDGIGIPKNEQVHVFEKFFRSELAKRNGIAGTGLGLFVVKEIVERMGGSIWFWSEEGKGSRFSFALPVAS
ncbi:MAG: sensor histidine kinase [Candidatus Wildermuthbacteria bacterium]|nr:sensor histidine kinase [Candidatus Wildermuthbacteria bacterium]